MSAFDDHRDELGDYGAMVGRRGGRLGFAVMVTEFRDESGKLVAEARMTGGETARPPEVGGAADERAK